MAKRGRPKKDPFANLSDEFKDSMSAKSEEEIRKIISESAMNEVALLEAKKNDTHLQECVFAAKEAGEVYKNGSKENRAKIEFCRQVLSDRGVQVPSFDETVEASAN